MQAPVYATLDCIYPGPHINDEGKIDSRVWFKLPIELNLEEGSLTFLIFPFGASEEEIIEKKVSTADLLQA